MSHLVTLLPYCDDLDPSRGNKQHPSLRSVAMCRYGHIFNNSCGLSRYLAFQHACVIHWYITSGSNRCSNRYHCPSWSWKESSILSYPFATEHIESWWTNRNVSERICRYARPKSGINVGNSDQIDTKSEILSRQSNQNIFYRI